MLFKHFHRNTRDVKSNIAGNFVNNAKRRDKRIVSLLVKETIKVLLMPSTAAGVANIYILIKL